MLWRAVHPHNRSDVGLGRTENLRSTETLSFLTSLPSQIIYDAVSRFNYRLQTPTTETSVNLLTVMRDLSVGGLPECPALGVRPINDDLGGN